MSILNPKKISDEYYVIGQIQPSDVIKLKEMGFKTILNNRPEKEDSDQPLQEVMKNATQEAGLEYYYLPIISTIDKEMSKSFLKILKDSPKPILAFCRTGTRCAHLWTESISTSKDFKSS